MAEDDADSITMACSSPKKANGCRNGFGMCASAWRNNRFGNMKQRRLGQSDRGPCNLSARLISTRRSLLVERR